jgi:hypothetical protein
LFCADPDVGFDEEELEVEDAPPFEAEVELDSEEDETREVPPTAFGFETSKS